MQNNMSEFCIYCCFCFWAPSLATHALFEHMACSQNGSTIWMGETYLKKKVESTIGNVGFMWKVYRNMYVHFYSMFCTWASECSEVPDRAFGSVREFRRAYESNCYCSKQHSEYEVYCRSKQRSETRHTYENTVPSLKTLGT